MSVVIETTLGDITVDLYIEQRPVTCLNFLKLCKMKFYNYNLFHTIRSGFIAQTGDPTGEGSGGQSIFGLLEGPEKRFFSGEKMPKIRHTNAGLLSMVCTGDMMVGSQFFFTLAPDLDSLNPVHCVIGEVTEGHDVLRKLNEVICDETYRPYQDVRITHTVVLEDPFNDPKGFRAPSRSPSPSAERLKGGRIAPDEEIDETQGKTAEEIQELIEEKEAKARATILEIVGDLPDADIAPPENVLFVCKLNPVTTDEDLEIIFSRFGKIVSCEVIRDKKTGDSLQYAFIEFADKKYCEEAYFKMDNVLIDDRRIHVDFSQSVSKMRWLGKGRGVRYFNDEEAKHNHNKEQSNRPEGKDRRENKDRQWGDRNKRYDNEKWNNHDTDKHNEKRHHLHKTRDMENHKRKSRSRSRSRLEKSRSDRRDNSSRNQNYSKSTNNEDSHKYTDNKERENRSSHRSKTLTSTKSQHLEHNDKYDRRKNYEYSNNNEKDIKESQSKLKRKQFEDTDSLQNHKRVKKHKNIEPHTPSPVSKKNKLNRREKDTDIKKKKKNVKKKRKPSTSSSDSESSDSSSSSSDSSSSSEDRNRKRIKRRKKKYSSSSSSESSSSSSSTSSSDSSSESTSSSSNSEPSKRKRNKKPSKRHITKKSKKKS